MIDWRTDTEVSGIKIETTAVDKVSRELTYHDDIIDFGNTSNEQIHIHYRRSVWGQRELCESVVILWDKENMDMDRTSSSSSSGQIGEKEGTKS